ncbi:Hypothetical Protein PANA_3165 [Pantoea ananatis LMG 20103]|uniref:Uncharacterized protein n=1 Tax=Pantoea ananatis (strain LMG 20103) TaxID=706191 RepID=D4GM64_PANAM|nr:Hypothetical Protein PANA_3165 [Pantoea ananatis LMG 20103]
MAIRTPKGSSNGEVLSGLKLVEDKNSVIEIMRAVWQDC